VFAIQAQRAGTKISPARKGWVHRQAVERRRCGTTLFVCSLGAADSLKRVGREMASSTGNRRSGAPHPRFPVKSRGFRTLHAPFLRERRTRSLVEGRVQEIRGISLVFREMWDTTVPDVRLCRLFIRSEAEGSAVLRTSPGNAEYYTQTKLSSRLPRRAVGSAVCFYFSLRF
jgi:hypothetical protein